MENVLTLKRLIKDESISHELKMKFENAIEEIFYSKFKDFITEAGYKRQGSDTEVVFKKGDNFVLLFHHTVKFYSISDDSFAVLISFLDIKSFENYSNGQLNEIFVNGVEIRF